MYKKIFLFILFIMNSNLSFSRSLLEETIMEELNNFLNEKEKIDVFPGFEKFLESSCSVTEGCLRVKGDPNTVSINKYDTDRNGYQTFMVTSNIASEFCFIDRDSQKEFATGKGKGRTFKLMMQLLGELEETSVVEKVLKKEKIFCFQFNIKLDKAFQIYPAINEVMGNGEDFERTSKIGYTEAVDSLYRKLKLAVDNKRSNFDEAEFDQIISDVTNQEQLLQEFIKRIEEHHSNRMLPYSVIGGTLVVVLMGIIVAQRCGDQDHQGVGESLEQKTSD